MDFIFFHFLQQTSKEALSKLKDNKKRETHSYQNVFFPKNDLEFFFLGFVPKIACLIIEVCFNCWEYFFLFPPPKSGPFFYCRIQSLFDHKFFEKKLIFLKGFTVVFDHKITNSRKYLIKINKWILRKHLFRFEMSQKDLKCCTKKAN